MNKSELIDALADRLGVGKREAQATIDALLETITRAVVAGEKVAITGFGIFEKVERGARTARNPRTGATVRVKKTAVPKFRPGAELKAFVSGAKKLAKAARGRARQGRGHGEEGRRPAKKAAPARKAAPAEEGSGQGRAAQGRSRPQGSPAKKAAPAAQARRRARPQGRSGQEGAGQEGRSRQEGPGPQGSREEGSGPSRGQEGLTRRTSRRPGSRTVRGPGRRSSPQAGC